MDRLEEARRIISEIDDKMAKLFVRRMEASQTVAEYKKAHGLPVLDVAREEAVIRRGSERVENDELRAYYVNFIRNNMALSRSYQHKLLEGMKVAFCGTEGAFAHIATCKLFPTAQKMPYGDFVSAYRAVEAGECDVAVLPVENSYNGEVGQVTDLMFSGSLYINQMFDLAVSHDLLVVPGADRSGIRTVISHPQALGQCAEYIHNAGWQTEEYLNIAKKTAHYFIAAVCDDFLPRCDFRSPKEPTYYDSTAGAIAACGLLEIEKYVPQYEKEMYHNAAVKILMAMEEKFCNWDDAEEAILTMGTESYKDTGEKNVPIIYGDYFFVEALYKLRGNEILFW